MQSDDDVGAELADLAGEQILHAERATDLGGAGHVTAAEGILHALKPEHGVDVLGADGSERAVLLHGDDQELVEDAGRFDVVALAAGAVTVVLGIIVASVIGSILSAILGTYRLAI